MVPLDPRGVIFSLKNSFTQHDEWPGKSDVIGRSPFFPDVKEGLPSTFCKGALEKTVLRGFRGLLCANLAVRSLESMRGGNSCFRIHLSTYTMVTFEIN
jgi:hypothetical protein